MSSKSFMHCHIQICGLQTFAFCSLFLFLCGCTVGDLFSSPGMYQSHPVRRLRANPSSSVTQLSVIFQTPTPPSLVIHFCVCVFVYLCICPRCICLSSSCVFAEVEVCSPGAWLCNLLLMRARCMCICVFVQSVFVCYLLVYLLRLKFALMERGSAICS